jgi:hypothetical protein
MMRLNIVALAFFAAPAFAQLPPLYCLDVDGNFCLSWLVTGPNITFSATCGTSGDASPMAWCGFGLSGDKSGSMAPADVMMITVDSATKNIFISDRNITAYASPPCFATAASTLLSSSVDASNVLHATWTRALAPGFGHVAITNGWSYLIAASVNPSVPTVSSQCLATMPEHDRHVEKMPFNFFNPPPNVAAK